MRLRQFAHFLNLLFILPAALFLAFLMHVSSSATVYAQNDVEPAAEIMFVPLTNIKQVAVGTDHVCALTNTGNVKCWGRDTSGQLGNNVVLTDQPRPTNVTGLPLNAVGKVDAGGSHSCAVTVNGELYCWGSDFSGQLGNGTDSDADHFFPTAIQVPGIVGVVDISLGGAHSCALLQDGTVKCWGANDFGQVGAGSSNDLELAPLPVSSLTGVIAISSGVLSTCALRQNGEIWCWGYNADGQLGTGSVTPDRSAVPLLSQIVDGTSIVINGYHACALRHGSGVWCWGTNNLGQLGVGAIYARSLVPVNATGMTTSIRSIRTGFESTCSLSTDGSVHCWGSNSFGVLGIDQLDGHRSIPALLPSLTSGVSQLSVGYLTACAVLLDTTVKCWGRDQRGEVGDGPNTLPKYFPVHVTVAAACYKLTLQANGAGDPPTVSSNQSSGCSDDNYMPGEQLTLASSPAENQRVNSWSSPASANPGDPNATLIMPSADTTLTVTYGACNPLMLAHTGAGGNPDAAPRSSPGCAVGRFATGDRVVLTAVPNAGQRVKSWAGAGVPGATGSQVNAVTMPNSAATVTVAYETCFALATTVVGQGEPIVVSPGVSEGCLTGGFAEGQSIALSATPAAGWRVAGWSGTVNDASTGATNSSLMPAAEKTVGVVYEQIQVEPTSINTFLPVVGR